MPKKPLAKSVPKSAARPAAGPATGPAGADSRMESGGQTRGGQTRVGEIDWPKPLLPRNGVRFAAEPGGDQAVLYAKLSETVRALRDRAALDPFSNSLLMSALELTRMMDRNEIVYGDLEQIVQRLTAQAFLDKAERVSTYLGTIDPDENLRAIESLADGVARAEGFEGYVRRFGRAMFGIVFTAHPTFATTRELSRILIQLATGRDLAGKPLADAAAKALRAEAISAEHRPPLELTLDLEHEWSMEALANAQDALDRIHAVLLAVAARHFPERWTGFDPRPMTLATWVGYDHDGRADITWADALAKRLRIKRAQIDRYRARLGALIAAGGADPSVPTLELIQSLLALASKQTLDQFEAITKTAGGSQPQRVAIFARLMVEGRATALTDTARLRQLLDRAIEQADDDSLKPAYAALRSAMAVHGLGLGHQHFRLNSTQIHNAIRSQIEMETAPNDPGHRRTYLAAINDLLSRVRPVEIDYGAVMGERASARRMLMTIAQILKHVDSETPIRFLIAETETAFTLLTALYLAKLFGIEDKLEISPLFETLDAMERGDLVVDEALKSPHFRAYLEQHGRLAIQFGYSDSGRYVGQMAATFSIERLRLRLAAVLAKHKVEGVEVVLFDTHGESIGRGGHPVSMLDRFRYLAPPVSRAEFVRQGVAVKEETSFQGGDGFLYFMSGSSALSVLRTALETALDETSETEGDPVYQQGDYAAEFFASIKQFFAGIVEDPNYAALLGVYGTNLLYRTGSRPVKRQSEGWSRPSELTHPSQLRAIPNNGVLQQLGVLANTISGVGQAATKDPELFHDLMARSPRFRRAMAMVEYALTCSDLDTLRAYLDTLDPGMWLNRSGRTRSPIRREELRGVTAELETIDLNHRLLKVYRKLQADYLSLREIIKQPSVGLSEARRETLLLTHAVRLAVMHRIYFLATHIPEFSPQHGVTFEEVFARIVHMDVEGAVQILHEIFPRLDPSSTADLDFGEQSNYRGDRQQTYEMEHERLFKPLADLHELARRLGTAITYQIGAVG